MSWISGNYIGECSFDIVFENGVPIYHAENISSNFQHELNINCALATVPHVITAVANPEEGGTVEGAGTYDGGTVVTLTATPNEGYLFLNWSKNGMVVSCNATYNFTVTEDLDLEAVFMRLEGTLIGQGESTNQYLPSYSYYNYTLSQQIYSPDEIGEGGSITTISYFNAGGTKTRIYDIYMVHTDKLTFDSNTDWITVSEADRVYSGSVTLTQGYWTTIVLDTPFDYDGISNLAVIVDDNTGTGSSGMACRVFNANGDQAICSYNYGTNYDPYDPSGYSGTRHSVKNQIILGIETEVEQTFTLPEGWSWWSTYIEADDLLNQLEASLGTNGMSINTQGAVLVYRNGMWMGGMSSIENKKGYKIKTNAPVEVTIVGQVVNPANCPITITEGANWIGYPLSTSQTVGNALVGFTPSNGDVIMTQGGTTVYRSGHWMPATFTFEPGKGYVYKSTSSETKTLIFSNGK